jgi:hypothetical protein
VKLGKPGALAKMRGIKPKKEGKHKKEYDKMKMEKMAGLQKKKDKKKKK